MKVFHLFYENKDFRWYKADDDFVVFEWKKKVVDFGLEEWGKLWKYSFERGIDDNK